MPSIFKTIPQTPENLLTRLEKKRFVDVGDAEEGEKSRCLGGAVCC